jgi:hypothetical protein
VSGLLGYAPIAAACFGVPQFVPQLLKLRATNDCAGVSWSWAALTSVNNAAWIAYFALFRYWAPRSGPCHQPPCRASPGPRPFAPVL